MHDNVVSAGRALALIAVMWVSFPAQAESEYDMFRFSPAPIQPPLSQGASQHQNCRLQSSKSEAGQIGADAADNYLGALLPVYTGEGVAQVLSAQFQPTASRYWVGNLKRYRAGPASADSSVSFALMSEGSDTPATTACVDGRQRCIAASARSGWTASVRADGDVVARGGLANLLAPVARRHALLQVGNMMHSLKPVSDLHSIAPHEKDLVEQIARELGWTGTVLSADVDNPFVVAALNAFNRLAGIDVDNAVFERLKARDQQPWVHRDREIGWFGASVFGAPLQIDYDIAETEKRSVIWWSTSDGFLRGFDASSGQMLVAVLPEAVIPSVVVSDPQASGEVLPGLDTAWVALRHDHNHDGKIRRSDGDYVYLYGGMRRGGNRILGWDVTEPASPVVLFELSSKVNGFADLAYTWSQPLLANVWTERGDQPDTVLVFGGGYDHRLDAQTATRATGCAGSFRQCGAAIYMVKATGGDAGTLLWSLQVNDDLLRQTTGEPQPITAPLRVLDRNGDGISDLMYALDLQGRMFRIDLPQKAGESPSVRLVADVSLESDSNDDNAFFHAPGITILPSAEHQTEVVLVFGAGNIAQPYGSMKRGRLFVLRDLLAATPVGNAHRVIDATQTHKLDVSMKPAHTSKPLWLLPPLEAGEKLAFAPVIVDGKGFFTTFLPPDKVTSRCQAMPGRQRVWALDLHTGQPAFDNAGDIPAGGATRYVSEAVPASGTNGFSLLLHDQHWSLLRGVTEVHSSTMAGGPQRLRWRQLMTGPGVQKF